MLESLGHVALGAATALSWLGLGTVLARNADPLNRFGLGAVAFAFLTFAAGWLGVLYAGAYVPVFVATAIVGARSLPRVRLPALRGWQLALAVVIVLYAVAAIVVTCAPISSADALYYHATLPERFEAAHALEEVPEVWQSYQPFLVQLLVLDGFLLWDSVQGAFAPLLLGLTAAATVATTANRLAGRTVALLATAIFLAQPFALWLLTSTFVEPGAALFVALAVSNLVRYVQAPQTVSLMLAGMFTGAVAGVKYAALGAAVVLALAALYVVRGRVLAFALPALAVALPWYVKNAILTGDPVYPLLGWPNEETRLEAESTFSNFGYGDSALDLLLLPVRLLADAEPFNRAEYITPLFLLFAPLSLFVARRWTGLALAAVAAYVVGWFFNVQDARYLFFVMPVLAVLAAIGVVELARFARPLTIATTIAAFAVGAGVTAVYSSQFVPVVAGLESDDAFLTKTVSYHEATVWLNENLPPDARVALGHAFVLHVDRPAMTWTGEALRPNAGREETREFFRRYGITHALVFTDDAPRTRQLGYVGGERIARLTVHAVTSRALSRVGPEETMDVYRVNSASVATPSAHAAGVNLRASSSER